VRWVKKKMADKAEALRKEEEELKLLVSDARELGKKITAISDDIRSQAGDEKFRQELKGEREALERQQQKLEVQIAKSEVKIAELKGKGEEEIKRLEDIVAALQKPLLLQEPKRVRLKISDRDVTFRVNVQDEIAKAKTRIQTLSLESPEPPTIVSATTERDLRYIHAERRAALDLLKLVEGSSGSTFSMFLAVSGSGKTSSMFEAAMDIFAIYVVCGGDDVNGQKRLSGDFDQSFQSMVYSLMDRTKSISDPFERTLDACYTWASYLFTRLIYLCAFLEHFEDATPYQWLRLQSTSNFQDNIVFSFGALDSFELSRDSISNALRDARNHLQFLLEKRHVHDKLLICVDELEGAAAAFGEKFISLVNGDNSAKRDFVYPLARA